MCETQKAAGLLALKVARFNTGKWETAHSRDEAALLVTTGIEDEEGKKRGPVKEAFARPAPPLPIPGFVPSRKVTTAEEAQQAWDEAQQGAAGAELILHERIEANLSACWTPGLLAIGSGTDGATSGRDSIAVPVCATPSTNAMFMQAIEDSRINEHPDPLQRNPHVELLFGGANNATMTWVQLRAGAAASGSGDYVPKSGTITRVEQAPDDDALLMAWGDKCRAMAKEDGFAVAWKPGGTQACHAALHAKGAGIPIFFGKTPPKVGDKVEATVKQAHATPKDVLIGISQAWHMKLDGQSARRAVTAAFCMLHGYSSDGGRYLGLSVGILMRAAVAACLGEMRHLKAAGMDHGLSREQVYNKSWADKGNVAARAKMPAAIASFTTQPWHPGFGGAKWGNCAKAAVALDAAVIKLAKERTEDCVGAVVMAANDLICQLHNGGKLFNKFMDQGLMDRLSSGDLTSTLQLTPQLWEVHKLASAIKPARCGTTAIWWRKQEPLAAADWAPPQEKPGIMAIAQYRVTDPANHQIRVQVIKAQGGHSAEENITVPAANFKNITTAEFSLPSAAGTNAKYAPIEGTSGVKLPAQVKWTQAGLLLKFSAAGGLLVEKLPDGKG